MVEDQSLIKDLVDRILRANYATSKRLRALQSREYPSATPIKLIEVLLRIHGEIAETLREIRTGLGAKEANQDHEDEITIRRYGHLVFYIHALLEVIEAARVELVSASSVILVRDLSRNLKGIQFLVIPQYEYTFSYQEVFAGLVEIYESAVKKGREDKAGALESIKGFGDRLAILRFPQAERDSILLNVMLAHEVGHAICQQNELAEAVIGDLQIDRAEVDELLDELEEAVQTLEETQGPLPFFFHREVLRALLMSLIMTATIRWTEELLCDAIAFVVLGPAYILAFSEFLLSVENVDDYSITHPAARIRLSMLLALSRELGYLELLENYHGPQEDIFVAVSKRMGELRAVIDREKAEDPDGPLGVASRTVSRLGDKIVEKAIATVGPNGYPTERFLGDLPTMCEQLAYFVPPTVDYDWDKERMAPAHIVSVLNAGACFEVARRKSLYELFQAKDPDAQSEIDARFEKLVSKAIELSDIFSRSEQIKSRWKDE